VGILPVWSAVHLLRAYREIIKEVYRCRARARKTDSSDALAQAIGQSAILQGYRVLYRETHGLLDELADAVAVGTREQFMEMLATVPLLIIDDFGMRKLPLTAAEARLEIVMRRYERASTLLTSNRPVEDWGELLGDVASVSSMLDRILHHGHVLKCGPRSWRTKAITNTSEKES
jgi:DNA replication protein DnaC